MIYDIKSIPTIYNNVQFRSRLEARWAAFFDLAGIKWDYEPFDLEGWAPDFLLRTAIGPVLCEVKPADIATYMERQLHLDEVEPFPFNEAYSKANKHACKHAVCLLGDAPLSLVGFFPIGLFGQPPVAARFTFDDMDDALSPKIDAEAAWRQAGNLVQWAASGQPSTYEEQANRIFKRVAA